MNFIKNKYTDYVIKLDEIDSKKHNIMVIMMASFLLFAAIVITSLGNYIAIGYLLFSMIYGVLGIINDLKIEYMIIICFPFYLLYAILINIVHKRIPYSGNDPLILRSQKLKILTRKVRINRLKFWK